MTETRSIQIPVYRDEEGSPVCGNCILIRYDGHQLLCKCKAGEPQFNLHYTKLFPCDATPHKNCPLWAEELKNA